jgi:putative glutamine amidotransferase
LIGITTDLVGDGRGGDRAQLDPAYAKAILCAGGTPLLLAPPTDPALLEDFTDDLVERLAGIIFSGGDDLDPARYGASPVPEVTLLDPRREVFELTLVAKALERHTAVLGICNGIQLLNVVRGGSLIVHLASGGVLPHQVPRPATLFHQVRLEPGSQLARIWACDSLRVNSHHHQALDRLGHGVQVAARASDGVVEAIELSDTPWAIGVQWHPEKLGQEPHSQQLFAAFVKACHQRSC